MKSAFIVEKLFENKKRELMRSPEAWEEYLETAGKFYKYDFAYALLYRSAKPGRYGACERCALGKAHGAKAQR